MPQEADEEGNTTVEAGGLVPRQGRLTDAPISVDGEDDDDHTAGSDECVTQQDVEICEIILETITSTANYPLTPEICLGNGWDLAVGLEEKHLVEITNSREEVHQVRHRESLQVVESGRIELGAGEDDDGGEAANKPEKHEYRPNE